MIKATILVTNDIWVRCVFHHHLICSLQADKDKIEEELKRLKKAESWVRRSTTPTSPSLSPSTSVEELTAVSGRDGHVEEIVLKNVLILKISVSKLPHLVQYCGYRLNGYNGYVAWYRVLCYFNYYVLYYYVSMTYPRVFISTAVFDLSIVTLYQHLLLYTCLYVKVAKQVTKRERDMVIRNSELSFRVRTLEDGIGELRKDNAEMVR